MPGRPRPTGRWTTRRFALDGAEWVTTAAAASVSTSAYLRYGRGYLAPGVVGDLLGFGLLSLVLRTGDARARHEAALCLACIGLVTAAGHRARLRRIPEPFLWGAFAAGLGVYLRARQRTCQ